MATLVQPDSDTLLLTEGVAEKLHTTIIPSPAVQHALVLCTAFYRYDRQAPVSFWNSITLLTSEHYKALTHVDLLLGLTAEEEKVHCWHPS